MAGTRLYVFLADTTLTADQLNNEFNNILSTSDQLIGTPRSASFDINAQELIMDLDGDSSFQASTDDRLDLKLGNTALFYWGTVTSAVNGVTSVAAITAEAPEIQATGTDTNISLDIVPKGTGDLQVNGGSMSPLAWQVYGA